MYQAVARRGISDAGSRDSHIANFSWVSAQAGTADALARNTQRRIVYDSFGRNACFSRPAVQLSQPLKRPFLPGV